MASSDSQIDKPQRRRPKRAELPNVNINTGAQSVNSGSFFKGATGKKWVLFDDNNVLVTPEGTRFHKQVSKVLNFIPKV